MRSTAVQPGEATGFRLSAEQVAASTDLAGPVRVVAGAGTGKTAVIAERVRRLVESGVDPRTILVLTFTERAASEMRERILATAPEAEPAHIGTFHALALSWLRDDGALVGLRPGFRLLTGPDRWILARELMWELGDAAFIGEERPDDQVGPLLKLQERLKQELVPVSRLAEWAGRETEGERRPLLTAAARLFEAHAERCRSERLADFDDLIALAARLLERRPDVRERYQRRFRWILVDEYQDTNLAQQRLVELLAGGAGNVCAVGDDDQSIYRFRGASKASFSRFARSYPGARTLSLGANRRSDTRIVSAARELVERNSGRIPKSLRAETEVDDGAPVEVWRFADSESEAWAIVDGVARLRDEGFASRRIAVLTRTHAIAMPILAALERAGIPHRHRGAEGLYRRPEIRDLIAHLRLLNDPGDLVALARLAVRPPLSLDLEGVMGRARGAAEPLRALAGHALGAAWSEMLVDLVPLTARLGVDDLLFELLDRSRYLDHAIAAVGELEGRRVVANVSRFAELVGEYCDRRRDHSLVLFLEYVELVLRSGVDEDEAAVEQEGDAVQVMSIHQAKGLEFDAVFIPALVEGRLPQPHRPDPLSLPVQVVEPTMRGREDHTAEERRLLYVGMTRARRRLILTWAGRYQGSRRWRPSRFLTEIGEGVRFIEPATNLPPAGEREALDDPKPESAVGDIPRTLSFTAISAYLECPRRYLYRHRLRIPAPRAVEAQFGSILHLTLQRAGEHRRRGGRIDPPLLERLYLEAWDEVGLADPRRRPALEAVGRRMLETFLAGGGLDAVPRHLEAPFSIDLGSWTLRGVIDRIDEMPVDGGARWLVVDYKTGGHQPPSRLRGDLQLARYALGAAAVAGSAASLEALRLEIVYLRDGRRVEVPVTAALLDEAREAGDRVAAGIAAGSFEPRPERRRCALCAYRLACEGAH
jgi:DNA helicase-2/ATP-dependent DNA helicase PcrA